MAASPGRFYAREKEREGEWAEATVFKPGRISCASDSNQSQSPTKTTQSQSPTKTTNSKDKCPICKLSPNSPWSKEDKDEHIKHCRREFQSQTRPVRRSMEKSKRMECSICLENILDTQNPLRLQHQKSFGILDNCNHKFCLPCIRRWRSDEEIQNYRKCPYCRTPSDFVAPAVHWVEENDKEELINKHKGDLRQFKTLLAAMKFNYGATRKRHHTSVYAATLIPMTPDLNDLSSLKMEQRRCVEEEMAGVEVDYDLLHIFVEIIRNIMLSKLKKIIEDYGTSASNDKDH